MDLKLTGKGVLVTGSSRGIGWATAKAFAAEGCWVMLSARSTEQLHEAETALRATGAEVAAHAGDVGNPDHARGLIQAAVAAYGGSDILVNNVGGGGGGTMMASRQRSELSSASASTSATWLPRGTTFTETGSTLRRAWRLLQKRAPSASAG
jgi:NAD(P)-dependent dehydrogenase (short-subunit alcohol dehydrogenase family)